MIIGLTNLFGIILNKFFFVNFGILNMRKSKTFYHSTFKNELEMLIFFVSQSFCSPKRMGHKQVKVF